MKFSVRCLRQQVATCALATGLILQAGCAIAPGQLNPATPPSYAELMASADEAHRKGGIVEAMGLYEQAAKADPSKKEPWTRIAQSQFDARNYGAAISAAQEVLQRDTTDVTAKSIMAVSGLRVSASALEQLRFANALGGSAREEAQSLARIMRDALGESILPSAAGTASVPTDKPATRPAVRRVAPPPSAPPAAPATAPAAAEPKRNPFDALKG